MATKPVNETKTPADFRAVISLWPSCPALAEDLGVQRWLTEAWQRRNSIPPRWFDRVIRAAIKRDIEGVTAEILKQLHLKRMEEGPPAAPVKKNLVESVGAE